MYLSGTAESSPSKDILLLLVMFSMLYGLLDSGTAFSTHLRWSRSARLPVSMQRFWGWVIGSYWASRNNVFECSLPSAGVWSRGEEDVSLLLSASLRQSAESYESGSELSIFLFSSSTITTPLLSLFAFFFTVSVTFVFLCIDTGVNISPQYLYLTTLQSHTSGHLSN